jgi:tight adherence protein B
MLFLPVLADLAASAYRVVRIKGRLTGDAPDSQNRGWELLLADCCTNGVAVLRMPSRLCARMSVFNKVVEGARAALSVRISGCNSRAIGESLLALSILSGLVAYVLSAQVLLALAGLMLPAAIVQMQAQKWLRERREQLREQLPDALRGLGMCFMAGLSLEQAFDQTAQECREPLCRELRRTVDDLRTGSTVMESLDELDTRLAFDEMRFVSVALEIQHRTGGSMREVLDAAVDSMLASFDLSRSLEVQTAQARMSARIVSALPLALVLVLSVAMDGYLATFFSSAEGFTLLICAIGMELSGIFIIRRILGMDLE